MKKYISQVYCVWLVVKTLTIIFNNPVQCSLQSVWTALTHGSAEVTSDIRLHFIYNRSELHIRPHVLYCDCSGVSRSNELMLCYLSAWRNVSDCCVRQSTLAVKIPRILSYVTSNPILGVYCIPKKIHLLGYMYICNTHCFTLDFLRNVSALIEPHEGGTFQGTVHNTWVFVLIRECNSCIPSCTIYCGIRHRLASSTLMLYIIYK